jgi:tetratricopeptide (TPR) repeat protein
MKFGNRINRLAITGWVLALVLSLVGPDIWSATVSRPTYRLLQRAEDLIEKSAYQEALAKLNAMLPKLESDSLDKAVVLRTIAFVHIEQGKYANAEKALEQSLAIDVLPDKQAASSRLTLGEIYASNGKPDKAVTLLEEGLSRIRFPTGQQYLTLASVYYQLKQYQQAKAYMNKAIAGKGKPDESWYRMLLSIHYQLGDYKKAVQIAKDLIERFAPNRDYWLQLIGLYQELNQYEKALAANEVAYNQGFIIEERYILNLANLMSYQETPYKAAELMMREIVADRVKGTLKNWEKVADMWVLSREYDRAVLALKKASAVDPTGEIAFKLGRIYIEQEKWKEAHAQLLTALQKGGLKKPGEAHLLFGMSCYELHFNGEARKSFVKARQYSNTRKSAKQWVEYIDSER